MATTSVSKLLSKPETARLLNISIATLDRRIADGSINYFKQGWRISFSDEQIQEYLAHCLNAPRQRQKPSLSRNATRQRGRKAA
jgi:predicted DNA-binding transcriptional regulator AlpA